MTELVHYRNVGKVTEEKTHLKNTYLVTNDGKLIPDLMFIFGDGFCRSIEGLYHSFSKRYKDLIPEMKELIPQSYHEVRRAIDEVLKICDPKASFGYVEGVTEEGMYCPDGVHFFNSCILRRLFELARHPNVDENGEVSQTMEELYHLWSWMKNEYDELYEPLYKDIDFSKSTAEPTPPKTEALGLQLDPVFYE